MLSLRPNGGIYLCSEPVDMRRSFDGLSVLVMDVLDHNPLSGSLFVFANRTGDKLKVLYYDGQGLCLFYKRLERGRFRIPASAVQAVELTPQELTLLLEGLAISLAAQRPRKVIETVAWKGPNRSLSGAFFGILWAMESLLIQTDNDPQALLSRLHSQQQTLTAQSLEIQAQTERIALLEQQLDWLKRQVFGRKSERIVVLPGQAELFPPEDLEETPLAAVEVEQISYQRRKPKRSPLPKDLPRERIELDVEDGDKVCSCCDGQRRRIGEEITEELAFQPAKFWVRDYVRFKYACPHCEEGGVVTAPLPPRPIPKGIFGPEVLAQLLVSKYEDHLPLHRQLKIFKRHGIELSESTVNDSVLESARLLTPLTEALKGHILEGCRIFTDDTPVTLKTNSPGESRQARLWVYRRQGDEGSPATVFDFTPNRCRDGPTEWLAGFQGYLQADAYPGYDGLYASGLIVEVGCWSHARRYFETAAKLHKKFARAHVALGYIRQLFRIERDIKNLSQAQRFWARRQRALPILREFKAWLDQQRSGVSTKSPFGEAVTYTLNQWNALVEYVNHGLLEISNNIAENAIRPVAVGRNYAEFRIMRSWGAVEAK